MVGQVGRDERVAAMLRMARELAAQGHRVQMIEAMLTANGHPEAAEFIDQPHIRNELRDIADRGTTAGRSGAMTRCPSLHSGRRSQRKGLRRPIASRANVSTKGESRSLS